jgi:hypothetical protein
MSAPGAMSMGAATVPVAAMNASASAAQLQALSIQPGMAAPGALAPNPSAAAAPAPGMVQPGAMPNMQGMYPAGMMPVPVGTAPGGATQYMWTMQPPMAGGQQGGLVPMMPNPMSGMVTTSSSAGQLHSMAGASGATAPGGMGRVDAAAEGGDPGGIKRVRADGHMVVEAAAGAYAAATQPKRGRKLVKEEKVGCVAWWALWGTGRYLGGRYGTTSRPVMGSSSNGSSSGTKLQVE